MKNVHIDVVFAVLARGLERGFRSLRRRIPGYRRETQGESKKSSVSSDSRDFRLQLERKLQAFVSTKNRETLQRAAATARGFIVDGDVLPPVGRPMDFLQDVARVANIVNLPEDALITQMKIDNLPIPGGANREGYCAGEDLYYWAFGLSDFLKFKRAAEVHCPKIHRLYELGGSTGRFFRHVYCSQFARRGVG
jgi:hypothetical protein